MQQTVTSIAADPHHVRTNVNAGAGASPLRSRALRALQALHVGVAAAATLGSAGLGMLACGSDVTSGSTSGGSSSSSSGSSGGNCVGGVIVNGQCEGKCSKDKCLAGNICIGNRCVLECASHADCHPYDQSCLPATEDDSKRSVTTCQPNGLAFKIGEPCPFGQSQCAAPLLCRTAGDGDADAFCTLPDCKEDKECGDGYYCGTVRDPHAICKSSPLKGNNSLCGKTKEDCIDLASPPAGTSYFEGSVCLLRRMCLKRTDCTACATDLDCSRTPGQRCVGTGAGGADKRCLADCKVTSDCGESYRCVSGSCTPRFPDGCKGTGKFCEPCLSDEDCGMNGSKMVCLVGDLSHERACFDVGFSTKCMSDADCPTSPGGKHGQCVLDSGSNVFQRCYLPFSDAAQKFTCW
jgi:hypothetical protein